MTLLGQMYMARFNAILLILIMALSSCVSHGTYQTPKPLGVDDDLMGVGIMQGFGDTKDSRKPSVDILYRRGLVKNVDVGLRTSGVLFYGGVLTIDAKYGVLRGPFLVSIDLGMSYTSSRNVDSDSFDLVGYHPMLMIGTERVYLGLKQNIYHGEGRAKMLRMQADEHGKLSIPSLVIGVSVGKSFRIQPELNCFFLETGSPILFPSIGLYATGK